MHEIHGYITRQERSSKGNHFQECWIDDLLTRETISEDNCTVYVDHYINDHRSIKPFTIHDELLVVFEGAIHDIEPDIEKQIEISLSKATTYDILAAAYRSFDWRFPQYLIGDYRFLIFDRTQRRLISGRDKTTYDPMYVSSDGSMTAVSTDLAALASEVEASVNVEYLGQYLTGTIESQQQTFYTDISRIPPGCVVVSEDGSAEIKRYYHPSSDKRTTYRQMTKAELGDDLREKLETAVSCRISSTETTGVFMSGGADSTALAGIASHSDVSPSLRTYSYTYPNTIAINEVEGIDAAISEYSLHNEQISLNDHWVLRDKPLYERAWATAPAVDPLLQPKDELLRRAASDGIKTVLVGDKGNMLDGSRLSIADALSSGHYRDAISTARDDPVYTTAAALVQYGIVPLLRRSDTDLSSTVQEPVRSRLTEQMKERVEARRQTPRKHEALQHLSDQETYRSLTSPIFDYRFDIFRKRAKYRGIRAVDPYQDARLVEFVFNLPPTYNLCGGNDKAIFRDALRDILPQYILSRKKTDRIEEEIAEGLRREKSYVTSLLTHNHLIDRGIHRQHSVLETDSMIGQFKDTKSRNTHLWEYLSAQAWLEHHTITSSSNR